MKINNPTIRDLLEIQRYKKVENERKKNIFYENSNQNRAGVAIIISHIL